MSHGPPRCWFARNAKICGFACNSTELWQPDWVGKVARTGTFVYGVETVVDAGIDEEFKPYVTMSPEKEDGSIRTVEELLASPNWKSVEGTQ